jgi:hypothetical protein
MSGTNVIPNVNKICHNTEMRRLNRIGFWERRVFSYFGYYPWECVICRKKRFLKSAGSKRSFSQTH